MDHFGIGQAMKGMACGYFSASRGTGRTTSLIESLKDGDRVVCLTSREADRLKRLCQERRLTVELMVVDPKNPDMVFSKGRPQGRTIFDHSWVEQYYLLAIEAAALQIDHLQRQSSGHGTAHYETKAAAREIARWNAPR